MDAAFLRTNRSWILAVRRAADAANSLWLMCAVVDVRTSDLATIRLVFAGAIAYYGCGYQ